MLSKLINQLQINIFTGYFFLIKVIGLRVNLDFFSFSRDVIRIIFSYNNGYKSDTKVYLTKERTRTRDPK